eukprot:1190938-Prorocentrum_minimum.AAC.2
MAQRRSGLHRVLDYADEICAVLTFFLESHSLNTRDASFAESLYELKRSEAIRGAGKRNFKEPTTAPLSARSRWLSLFFLVRVCLRWSCWSRLYPCCACAHLDRNQRQNPTIVQVGVPYAKAKLEDLYLSRTGGRLGLATVEDAGVGTSAPSASSAPLHEENSSNTQIFRVPQKRDAHCDVPHHDFHPGGAEEKRCTNGID